MSTVADKLAKKSSHKTSAKQVRLRLVYIDFWSAVKLSFLAAVAISIVTVVAFFMVYMVVQATGLIGRVDEFFQSFSDGGVTLSQFVGLPQVMAVASDRRDPEPRRRHRARCGDRRHLQPRGEDHRRTAGRVHLELTLLRTDASTRPTAGSRHPSFMRGRSITRLRTSRGACRSARSRRERVPRRARAAAPLFPPARRRGGRRSFRSERGR